MLYNYLHLRFLVLKYVFSQLIFEGSSGSVTKNLCFIFNYMNFGKRGLKQQGNIHSRNLRQQLSVYSSSYNFKIKSLVYYLSKMIYALQIGKHPIEWSLSSLPSFLYIFFLFTWSFLYFFFNFSMFFLYFFFLVLL